MRHSSSAWSLAGDLKPVIVENAALCGFRLCDTNRKCFNIKNLKLYQGAGTFHILTDTTGVQYTPRTPSHVCLNLMTGDPG